MTSNLDIVILGLSITSAWGNGHAVTYRGLVRELVNRGHRVLFLERDVPWYAENRDLPEPPWGTTVLYRDVEELRARHLSAIRQADVVIVGSYVPQGVDVSRLVQRHATGVRAFYDIDTPVTLAKLEAGDYEYLEPSLIPDFDLYLSFTGGPILQHIEQVLGAPRARALYCSADPELYRPLEAEPASGLRQSAPRWDLGYLGTYSNDRQPRVERLLNAVARELPAQRFVVAGPQYPDHLQWSENVERLEHVAPPEHPGFYASQRFTLNITRDDMIRWGHAPSIRLFEAAACGIPIVSDTWSGIETLFEPGEEILLAEDTADVVAYLTDISEERRRQIGARARARVLASHTARHRAQELETYVNEILREQ